MDSLLQDIRFAARTLIKAPAYAALAIITIAFGIGASTAVFSMVEGVLLRPLPYASNDRLIRLLQPSATRPDAGFSIPELADYRQVPELAAVSEYHSMAFQLYGKGEPQRVVTGVVSDNFFTMLGVKPLLGRVFAPGEEAVGAPPVVVLDYRYWVEKLGADPKVIGTTFTMNDHVHTIVGVLPPLPTYPDQNDMWMPAGACPFRSAPDMINDRAMRMVRAYGQIKPGVTLERATRGLQLESDRLHAEYPAAYPPARMQHLGSIAMREEMTSQSRPLLFTLLAMAAFVLLVAAANFANLVLSRQMRRGREVALRSALGASRTRLFRQLATESLVVTAAGGALGIAIAFSGLGLLRSLATRVTPRADEIVINGSVLGFAIVASVLVGLAAAIVPVLRRGGSLGDALRAGAVTTTASRTDGRVRGLLVLVQVAVACIVLVGAGLMTRSLLKLQAVRGGYDVHNVLTARVDLNWTTYTTRQLSLSFADALSERLRQSPGVVSVALASDFPMNNGLPSSQPFQIRGRESMGADGKPNATSDITVVSADYFKTAGIPILRGAVFSDVNRDTANVPALISQRLAATHWPDKDPIGEQILISNGHRTLTIVGVVGDVKQNGLSQDVSDEIYLPYWSNATSDIRVLVRTAGEPGLAAPSIRRAVKELDQHQPVVQVQTLEALRGTRLTEPRVTTALLVVFAVLALVITAAGLIGLVGQSVSQRLTEIGIRVALGAEAGQVLWAVMRNAVVVVSAGIVTGLIGASLATRLIGGLLYQLTPTDGLTYALVGVSLLAIAVLACLVPARRALEVQPVEAMRSR